MRQDLDAVKGVKWKSIRLTDADPKAADVHMEDPDAVHVQLSWTRVTSDKYRTPRSGEDTAAATGQEGRGKVQRQQDRRDRGRFSGNLAGGTGEGSAAAGQEGWGKVQRQQGIPSSSKRDPIPL